MDSRADRREEAAENERHKGSLMPGRQRTKAGTEFHVKGWEKMDAASRKALETIVDAAAKEMEEEEE